MSKFEIEAGLPADQVKLLKGLATKIDALLAALGKKPGKPATEDAADDDLADDLGDGEEEAEDGDGDGEEEAEDGDGEEEADEEEAKATRADVQAALRAYAAKTNKATALALMKKIGGTDALTKLKEVKFQAVIDAANKAAKAKK